MRYKRHGDNEPWGRLYHTKRWEDTKAYVIERAHGRCEECGKMVKGRFIIHHKELANEDNFFNLDILELTCQSCHNKLTFHNGMRRSYPKKSSTKSNTDLIPYKH
jgi:5-methylcytosine-specific restriction endonuclease McrA